MGIYGGTAISIAILIGLPVLFASLFTFSAWFFDLPQLSAMFSLLEGFVLSLATVLFWTLVELDSRQGLPHLILCGLPFVVFPPLARAFIRRRQQQQHSRDL